MVISKTSKFKGIDKNPSLLGFGCMRFPTISNDKPDIDEELSQKMIDYAYENGVNYFDTAYPYHNGLSELFIGKALKKYPRESFHLASKMPSWLIKSKDDAIRIFNEQLQKCQVQYFDYYLCHALGKEQFKPYLLPGVMDFLYQMKKEGKIRHLGFSFHDTPEVLDEIIHTFEWDFVQLQINYLDWSFINAKKMYEIVEDYGVPCIVMEPVRGGTLANLCDESQQIFKAYNKEVSIASWAIRYVASKPNVMLVLSGMSNMEQTIDNVKTMSSFKPITKEEQKIIDQALEVYMNSQTIPCTSCGYCMPCPHGVDIPGTFRVYNQYAISKSKWQFKKEYEENLKDKNADFCISCGDCVELCPQKIEIPNRMSEISQLFVSLKK
ncbi:MAG: aldo/keto reductase [Acholeplasmataceae bacterium]|nr:aldo/keto reductase [Acholeplasmataceae bacterium]